MEKEVSCRVTNSVIKYLESQGFETSSVLVDLPYSRDYLTNPFNWVTAETREIIGRRAAALTRDEKIMYQVGLATPHLNPLAGLELLVRLIGTPMLAYKNVPRLVSFFDNVLDFRVSVISECCVSIKVVPKNNFSSTPTTCYHTQGLMAAIPTLWNLPPAEVRELKCGCPDSNSEICQTGDQEFNACLYEVSWKPAPRYHFDLKSLFYRGKDLNFDAVKELERNFQLLDQKNAELVLRNVELESTRNQLVESEKKLRLTIESLSEGVLVTNAEGKITQANEIAGKLLGHHNSLGLIDNNALKYVSRRSLKTVLKNLEETRNGGSSLNSEVTLVRNDGSRFPAEITFSRFKNSTRDSMEFVTSVRDISQAKNSVKQLTESERKYRLIANNTTDFISILNFKGNYTYISPSHRLLGYEPEELVGKNSLELIHPDDRKRLLPLLLKHAEMKILDLLELKKQNRSESIEFKFPDKASQWHDMEATANLIEDKEGWSFNVLVISRDVTARKKADAENDRLYQEEKALRQVLEDEIKKRAEFFRALVHELKTPLTPIIASSEAVMSMCDDPLMKKLAANAFHGGVRLNSRVDELLDLSRGEMGMLKVNCQPMNILSLIKDLAGYVQPQIDDNHQKLELDIPEALPPVWADESRLRQVILNLLNNAMKFMPRGGLVTLRARTLEENVVVEVQDTGLGIDEADQKRLFQPYNRVEADRQHFSGLGLGLALCKKLIELHNGKIWVNSQKGQGSVFAFSISMLKEPPNSEEIKVQNALMG